MAIDIASFTLAGALTLAHNCPWNNPGRQRFTGDLVKAVDHYADLPAETRERLKGKLARHEYDDRVEITRTGISGVRYTYEPAIRDMHFGDNKVCRNVTVNKWPSRRKVGGLVYCDGEHCLLVPAVCSNLSRVIARPNEPLDIEPAAGGAGGGMPEAEAGGAPLAAAGQAAPTGSDGGAGGSGPAAMPEVIPDRSPSLTVAPEPDARPPTRWDWVPPIYFYDPPVYQDPGLGIRPIIRPAPAIPEPSTWLMWLVGMPVVGGIARRLRARKAIEPGRHDHHHHSL